MVSLILCRNGRERVSRNDRKSTYENKNGFHPPNKFGGLLPSLL